MNCRHVLGIALLVLIVCSACIYAADADKPAVATRVDTSKTRLVRPYSELKDLTADQTEQLKVIHRKFLDQVKALEAKQREDFMSVLTESQRKEVIELEIKAKAERKTKKDEPKPAAPDPKPADAK